jgi:hypothetical protein
LPGYRELEIDEERLASLPVDGQLEGIPTIDEEPELVIPSRPQDGPIASTQADQEQAVPEAENDIDEEFEDTDGHPATSTTVPLPPVQVPTELDTVRSLVNTIIEGEQS